MVDTWTGNIKKEKLNEIDFLYKIKENMYSAMNYMLRLGNKIDSCKTRAS